MVSAANDRCRLRVEVISYHREGVKQRCDADRCNNQLYRRHSALAARIMKYDVIRDNTSENYQGVELDVRRVLEMPHPEMRIKKYIQQKKRNAPITIFTFSSTFNTKMLIVMKYLLLIKYY